MVSRTARHAEDERASERIPDGPSESSLRPVPTPGPGWRRFDALPAPLNRFIGRERELAEVRAVLRRDDVRLVTLTGPGGVGKSRLALRVAEETQGAFADGAAFVALATVRDPELVLPAVARALRITEGESLPARERITNALHRRELLLLLDNFEQVVAASPELAALLQACPRLKLLVTSRTPLHLTGERLIAVPPLSLPDAEERDRFPEPPPPRRLDASEAVALFVERAQEVAPEFRVTAANAADVAAICTRTDGLPLAIELAAARMRVLSPADLVTRMSPRLPLLVGGPRDAPARLQTMRAAIAWSYGLLSRDAQSLFRRLAVFVGGWTLEAAEAVAGGGSQVAGTAQVSSLAATRHPPPATLDLLTALVEQSLVQRVPAADGAARFTMLETIREFGLEQVLARGEEAAARDAHADWCLAFAGRAAPELAGPDAVAWFNRIEAEIGNIRAVHAWLFARDDAARALRVGTTLAWFWQAAGYFQEGRDLFARLLAMPGADATPAVLADALGTAGSLEHHLGNLEAAQGYAARAFEMAQNRGDRRGVLTAQRSLGSIAVDRDELELAARLLAEVAAAGADHGAAWEAASAVNLLGVIAFTRGDYAAAMHHADAARAAWLAQGDLGHAAVAQALLATAAFVAGDAKRAARAGRDVLSQLGDVEDDTITAICFELAAWLAFHGGAIRPAARLLAAADAMHVRIGVPRRAGYQAWGDRLRHDLRRALGAAYDEIRAVGERRPVAAATTAAFAAFDRANAAPRRERRWGTEPAALTARERAVLRLLAEGLSDKEIAAALGISRHTASNHVTAIREKLGAPSRAAAAAMAIRDELI
jgi:predicted ATPase/DNA-binding CsgD family transcriptional regulator